MRRAKNYTAGVSRSPTGTSKQRRFTNKTTNKQKHAESSDTTQQTPESNNASTTPIQLVTSFALRTLQLEDIWFLKEGLPVLLFFHEESLPPRYSKKWLSIWRATLQSDFVPTVVCQGRRYKQLTGWVHANGDINQLTDANLTVPYKTIFAAMGEATQNTIRLKFPIMSPSSSNFVAPPTTDCLEEKLSWFEAFHFPQSVFLQADYHPERPWNATFKSVKDDSDDRLTLLHRLVQETPGDRFMLAELCSVWERFDTKTVLKNARDAMAQELNEKVEEATLRASKLYSPIIVKEVVEPFCKWVDTTLLQRIEDCFGRFNNIFEMFLSEYELRQIVSQFEKSLPNQFEAIMGYSGYTKKLESAAAEDREFLSLCYSLDTFFQFVVRARNHNNHLLVPFATVFAFAQYACGHSLMATQIPVWFGISVSKRTMERRVETWVDSYDARVRRSLRKVTFLMAVFDNLQDGRLLQFQQGQSAIYTRVTARFIMQMYLAKFPQSNAFLSDRPKLAYIEQDIPSPYQMPPFEVFQQSSLPQLIRSFATGNLNPTDGPAPPFDCTGTRVRFYLQIYMCCRELGTIKRFLSTKRRSIRQDMDYALQPYEFAYSNVRSSIAGAMNTLRRMERDASLFHLAGQFPSRVVREWRGEPPVAELLLLPVSILDETTKVGASGILLGFMVLHGLLTWDEDRGIYEPGLDWEEKWLFVVGDGLSIDRLFQFFDDLMAISDAKTSTFRAAYKQAMAITHVLHRVVPINGDLHVRFHMLDSIFRLFYGGLLQCVQHRLKWKRIDGNDVAQTYRQAHRLAVIVFEELDRLMIDAFLIRCFTQDRVDSFIDRGREEALATTIAKEYIQFLSRQVRESKDWLTVFSCNFLLIMRKYLMFHEAEQQGNSITMESIVIEFLPVFYIAKKSNSFNTQLRIIQLYYQRLPNYVLHQIRVNRTKRQKRGSTPSWNTKESALDQIMERIMPFLRQ